MKISRKSGGGTSFHGTTITATIASLIALLGKSEGGDGEKVNYEWTCETDKGDVFTIYDWKSSRVKKINYATQLVTFHIGGHTAEITNRASMELMEALSAPKKIGPRMQALIDIHGKLKGIDAEDLTTAERQILKIVEPFIV